jgi:hypothetical protein
MPVTAMSLSPQTPDFRCRQFPAAAARWTTGGFWLLIITSIAIAIYSANTVPGQRTSVHAANWLFRLVIGGMWWQQTPWKLPPAYTDHPEQAFGETGLAYWMTVIVSWRLDQPGPREAVIASTLERIA